MVDVPRDPDVSSDPNLDDPRDDNEPDEGTSSDWTSEGGAMPQGPATAPDASDPEGAGSDTGGQRSEVDSVEAGDDQIMPSDATAGSPLDGESGDPQEGAAGPNAIPRNDDRGRRDRA